MLSKKTNSPLQNQNLGQSPPSSSESCTRPWKMNIMFWLKKKKWIQNMEFAFDRTSSCQITKVKIRMVLINNSKIRNIKTYIRMIPNFAAHCEGFQRVWHTSGGCWDYSLFHWDDLEVGGYRPTFAFVRWKSGWKSYFGFTCLWLALPWIYDTGFAGNNTIWQSCCVHNS